MHTAPPGARNDVRLSIPQIAAAARAHGMEFVILTPHLWETTWDSPSRRQRWHETWREMAARARAQRGITMIPAVEWGLDGVGHFGVSGVALDTITGVDFLAAVDAAGAFVVANHPFVVPTRVPGRPDSYRNLSYTPWTTRRNQPPRHDPIDGVEVFNQMLRQARLVSERAEARGFVAADQLARTERRPIALVGGTDNHRHYTKPTTWVLATDAGEAAILAGLKAGATCVGSPDAGTLEAHGDADPPGRWSAIGESARATATVELRWTGRAHLFVDGADLGFHEHGWTHAAAGSAVHTYRIEIGKSRCGFVYANL
jgi:hypothetical protein